MRVFEVENFIFKSNTKLDILLLDKKILALTIDACAFSTMRRDENLENNHNFSFVVETNYV